MSKYDVRRRKWLNRNEMKPKGEDEDLISLLQQYDYLLEDLSDLSDADSNELNNQMAEIEERIGDNRSTPLPVVLQEIQSQKGNEKIIQNISRW